MAKQKTSEPLTGAALLQKVKTLAALSKTQKAKACGYYTVTKGGGERVNLLQFLQALIEAEGIALDKPAAERGRDGRSARYRITVQANGQLLIGTAYTQQMGLQPGDTFELVLGRKHFQLKPLDSVDGGV
ncbi:AbrB family transcriptional regulator [Stenomitos frigidus]|uniref:AbrB family transcriptional regulator n=1 Tax=Stenomitos frigidus ULC18 TaxID=2107698 RepID=A0A2T1ECT4_9CYAN|nr:AbrB family transcriptional regulator [Stenomitos frigidus]PSB30540.1 AbrB family transcriptional regulator [Stenomitos frigidus ULC18]